MSRIHLKDGPVLDPAKIECSPNAKRFLNYAFEQASFDSDLHTVGMRFAHAVEGIVSGVVLGNMLPQELRENRMEILHCMPEALAAFEKAYPSVELREVWAYWLSAVSNMHKACLPSTEYPDVARVAAVWWDARLIRPGARKEVNEKNLEGELNRIYERREEIDAVYDELFDSFAKNVVCSLDNGKPAIMHSSIDWMKDLATKADNQLFNLGEGGGGLWYMTEEIMKVTPTRVLVTGYDCEWIEVMPGDRLKEVTEENIFYACGRHAYGRFVDYPEWNKDD